MISAGDADVSDIPATKVPELCCSLDVKVIFVHVNTVKHSSPVKELFTFAYALDATSAAS